MNIKSIFLVLSFLLIFSAKAYGIPYKGNYIYQSEENTFYLSGQPGSYTGQMQAKPTVKALISDSCGLLVIKGSGIISYNADEVWPPFSASVNLVSDLQTMNPPTCNNGTLSEEVGSDFKDSKGNIYILKEPNKAYKVIYYSPGSQRVTFNECSFAVLKKPKILGAYWWLDVSEITINGKTYNGQEAPYVSSSPICKNGIGYVPKEWLSN
ncbi:MAG: hypothetical protein NHB32_24965 [Fischerella sp. CENA71]|nr:hypothetical protein [Fischerella sp. CENA71]